MLSAAEPTSVPPVPAYFLEKVTAAVSFTLFPAVIVPLFVTSLLNVRIPVVPLIFPSFVTFPRNVTSLPPQIISPLFVTVPLKSALFTFISAPELTVAIPETVSVPKDSVVFPFDVKLPVMVIEFDEVKFFPAVTSTLQKDELSG